jgi:hypothetical protein
MAGRIKGNEMENQERMESPMPMESQLPAGGCGVPAIDRYGREWATKLRQLESEIAELGVGNVDPNNDRQIWNYVYNVLQLEKTEIIPSEEDIPPELVSVRTLSSLNRHCSESGSSDNLYRFLFLMVEHKTFRGWLDMYAKFENAVRYYRFSIGE